MDKLHSWPQEDRPVRKTTGGQIIAVLCDQSFVQDTRYILALTKVLL
jgi:hypothetical protein